MKSVSLIYSKEWLERDTLMEGVEVLNTFVKGGCDFVAGIFAIIIGIISIAGIVTVIYFSKRYFPDEDGIATFMLSIIFLCLSVIGVYQSFFIEDTTYYQVIIDDSVSMVEFNEKYDIVNIEGKIYTIKEKGN